MTAPPISVVLPVYNAERFVGAALDSIASQTHTDFEAIVIDDGSTDGSVEVIRRHVGDDTRFRMIARSNKGLVASCNEGIEAARGRYIFRMDADDVSHPGRFARQLAYLEHHQDCVALGGRMLLADEELWPIAEMVASFSHDQIDAENLRGLGSAMCHPSVAMRTDAVKAVGGYRAEFEWAEDLDLFLRLAEVGRLANLREVVLTYRQHLDSVGYQRRALQAERTSQAVLSAKRRRGLGSEEAFEDAIPRPELYASTADIHRKWAWLSLGGGNIATARKHALRAWRLQPFSRDNPRLLACAARGH